MNKPIDYETDFYAWALYNAQLLREKKFSELDIEHLVEELEAMGKRDKRELANRFVILIAHLLKWAYQTHYRSKSWIRSIDEQRIQIKRLVQDNPHLKSYMLEAINSAYGDAVKLAAKETGIAQTCFPAECAYSIEQLVDEDFYPN